MRRRGFLSVLFAMPVVAPFVSRLVLEDGTKLTARSKPELWPHYEPDQVVKSYYGEYDPREAWEAERAPVVGDIWMRNDDIFILRNEGWAKL